jgi:hypothetical protein
LLSANGRDRVKQPTPIPDRSEANLFQVVGGQFWQHVPIDRIFFEGRRVLPEAETSQPLGNVHGFIFPPAGSLTTIVPRGKPQTMSLTADVTQTAALACSVAFARPFGERRLRGAP